MMNPQYRKWGMRSENHKKTREIKVEMEIQPKDL